MVSFGPEIKVYWNGMFVIPYLGYGISFDRGSIHSQVHVKGDIILESELAKEKTPFEFIIKKKAYPYPLNHRLIVGLEFSIYPYFNFGTELNIAFGTSALGLTAGFRFHF